MLGDDEKIEYSSNIDDAVPKKKPAATTPPLPNAGTKENQKQKQAPGMKNQETTSVMRQAKPRQAHGHDNFVGRSGTKIIRTPNPKEKQHVTNSGDDMQNHHQTQTVVNDVERKLSLKEYEEELLEKKKTLNLNLNLKNAADHEGRKLSPDKDFESMILVGKKKEDYDGLLIKPAKPNTKTNKVHNNKAVDVSRIFQVPVTRSRRPYAVDNGESTSTSTTDKADASAATATVNIGDGAQFPALK